MEVCLRRLGHGGIGGDFSTCIEYTLPQFLSFEAGVQAGRQLHPAVPIAGGRERQPRHHRSADEQRGVRRDVSSLTAFGHW